MRPRDTFPILHAFGDHQEFISVDQEGTADVTARIRGVWAFIVTKIYRIPGDTQTARAGRVRH